MSNGSLFSKIFRKYDIINRIINKAGLVRRRSISIPIFSIPINTADDLTAVFYHDHLVPEATFRFKYISRPVFDYYGKHYQCKSLFTQSRTPIFDKTIPEAVKYEYLFKELFFTIDHNINSNRLFVLHKISEQHFLDTDTIHLITSGIII